jgi:HAD superfamily hydrolase (TIGR01549 family)
MRIRAILFDLHQTLTIFQEHPVDIVPRISKGCGVDISSFSDKEREEAYLSAEEWFKRYQIECNVGIHYGGLPEHWVEPNRRMYEALGLNQIADDILLKVEEIFKEELLANEKFTEDSKQTIKDLHSRGYPIGVVTRRYDDPRALLARANLSEYISTIQWSGVIGYAKPSPYTLLAAAEDLGINPKSCAYVGNWVDADIIAAQRAQMFPILLTWANPEEAELAPEGTTVRTSPLELLNIFQAPDIPVEIT